MRQTEERWAALVDYPDYAVSTHGRVMNLKTNVILRERPNSYGYPKVALRKDGVTHDVYIHKLVAMTFISNYHRAVGLKHADREGGPHINNIRFQKGRRLGTILKKTPPAMARRVVIVELGLKFPSVESCAEYINGDPSSIYRVLRGERKNHKGYTFEYQYEEK